MQTIRTSINGALMVLDLSKRLGSKVLQASTSEVYGDPEVHPQPETYRGSVNPIGPRACYDEGKRCAETLFFDYRRQHGVRIKVARIFNTFGPSMLADDGRVVSNFIVQALQRRPITLYSAGTQTSAFCFVDDVVEGLIRLKAAPDEITGPVNLGSPEEITSRALAERIVQLCGGDLTLHTQPLPQDDPARRCPDIALAGRLLGWAPSVPLEEGLRRTIAYFERNLRPAG